MRGGARANGIEGDTPETETDLEKNPGDTAKIAAIEGTTAKEIVGIVEIVEIEAIVVTDTEGEGIAISADSEWRKIHISMRDATSRKCERRTQQRQRRWRTSCKKGSSWIRNSESTNR